MITLDDQCNRKVAIKSKCSRIICLVPSLSETICSIGLESKLIGVTKFCIHPNKLNKRISQIGGTKNPNISKIIGLHPDLIIANKEENRLEDIHELEKKFEVYVTDIKDINDVIRFLNDFEILCAVDNYKFKNLISELLKINLFQSKQRIQALYLIWQNPYMTVGNDTFIYYMMKKHGIYSIFDDLNRYPIFTIPTAIDKKPQVILLSSEPYPFSKEHLHEWKSKFPYAKVMLVDGEKFSWFGSSIIKAHEYLKNLSTELEKD